MQIATSTVNTDSNVLQKFTGSNATLKVIDGATLERANQPFIDKRANWWNCYR